MSEEPRRKWERWSPALRQRALERMRRGENVEALAAELGATRSLLYWWKQRAEGRLKPKHSGTAEDPRDRRTRELEKDRRARRGHRPEGAGTGFFRGCRAKDRGETPEEKQLWRDGIYTEIRGWMQSQGGLSIVRMCDLAIVSRASFYRHWEKEAPTEAEVALRDAIQRIAVAHRLYGYRRVTVLVQREGYEVGAKKVCRLMKEDNLLAVRRRKFVATTDSTHGFVVYPNLAEQLIVNDMNQLWVADITYVRLLAEFVYLAVVLDAFSRRAVGWALARNLQTPLPLAALEHAIASRQPRPGLVHHSDRGSQYASNDYVKRLESIGAVLSMSRPGTVSRTQLEVESDGS